MQKDSKTTPPTIEELRTIPHLQITQFEKDLLTVRDWFSGDFGDTMNLQDVMACFERLVDKAWQYENSDIKKIHDRLAEIEDNWSRRWEP